MQVVCRPREVEKPNDFSGFLIAGICIEEKNIPLGDVFVAPKNGRRAFCARVILAMLKRLAFNKHQ